MHPLHLANLQAAAAGVHRAAATSGFTLADILGIVTLLIIPIGVVALAALLARRRDPRDDGDGDSGWGRGGPGGWGRGGPGGPPWPDDGPRLPNGDPAWWPEFERQFAAYVGQEVGRFAPSRRSRLIRASATDGRTLSHPGERMLWTVEDVGRHAKGLSDPETGCRIGTGTASVPDALNNGRVSGVLT